MNNTKKIVLLALLVSQALVLSIIESWIPFPSFAPGVKLGLANIITLIVIIFFSIREAFIVVIVRTLLSSIYTGGMIVFLFSVVGGLLSAAIMAFLYKKFLKVFSLIGISIVGAIIHNLGQLGVAGILMKELAVFSYLPILLISGIATGCFVGLCTRFLVKALKKTSLFT